MKKIVRIISRLNIGGPALHTVLLSEALNKDGYKDILIYGKASALEGNMSDLAKDKNLKPLFLPELKREISLKNDLKVLFKLYFLLKKEKPDIVHTHASKAGLLGRLAAVLSGVPIKIHTFHGHIFNGYFDSVRMRLFLAIEKFLALFTDKIIVVSEQIKNDIVNKLKIVKASKCIVMPLGLDLEKFSHCEEMRGIFRKERGISTNAVLVGIVGRLVPIKNHRMFLAVAKNIINRNLPIKVMFVIIGDGELGNALREHVKKLDIEKLVIFTGWKRELYSIYADLDIVSLTSLSEGTPVSLIEAMAAGRPVVATDVGGVRDLIVNGENGFLVKSNNTEDFSNKLFSLLDDKETRLRFGRRGRELAIEKYSKKRLLNDIENLYDACFEKKITRSKGV